MSRHLISIIPLGLVSFLAVAEAADYEGTAVGVDGDTIELHVGDKVIPVRLCGIDSPEARHAGGPEASAKMASLIANKGSAVCSGRRRHALRRPL